MTIFWSDHPWVASQLCVGGRVREQWCAFELDVALGWSLKNRLESKML